MKYVLGITRLVPTAEGEPAGYYRLQEAADVLELELDDGHKIGDVWLAAVGMPGDLLRLPVDELGAGPTGALLDRIVDELEHQGDELELTLRLHPDDLAELRDQIIDALGGHVIAAALSSSVGAYIREVWPTGSYQWRFFMPGGIGSGYHGLFFEVRFGADGSVLLELETTAGDPVWRGTLRPVDDARRLVDDAGAAELADDDEHQGAGLEVGGAGVVDEAPR